uniref:Uncharacterized protein n=1 Tax=Myotis myotis TaxID=51298 RepID=A0A7J7TTP9_MYOMY|nr:hypothetical protein mMyoMyo1_008940 [Myotis myotis]
MGCRSVPCPAGEVDRGVPACCGHAPGRPPPQMRSVHLISGQELAVLRACLLRTASTFPAPGIWGIQCSARLRSLAALHPGEEKLATCSTADILKPGSRVLGWREVGGTDHLGAPLATPLANTEKPLWGRCLPHSLIGSQPGLAKPPSLPAPPPTPSECNWANKLGCLPQSPK